MRPDDLVEFKSRLDLLAATFRAKLADRAMDGYWQVLEKYPAPTVWAAMDRAMEEDQRFPVPAVLADYARQHRMSSGNGDPVDQSRPPIPKMQRVLDRTDCFCGNYKNPGVLVCKRCYQVLIDRRLERLVHAPYLDSYFRAALAQLQNAGIRRGFSPEARWHETRSPEPAPKAPQANCQGNLDYAGFDPRKAW